MDQLLRVQTRTGREEQMVSFLGEYCHKQGYAVHSDKHNNVYICKGVASAYPCVAAHIDTVQDFKPLEIVHEHGGRVTARHADTGKQTGFGADDKAGIFVCLELLKRMPVLCAVLFASEECGCRGAYASCGEFFDHVGYMVEFDAPGRNLVSYTSGGHRLFDNDGDFIKTAHPVLDRWGLSLWQHHPFTDVMAMRELHTFPCLNLSCGYYNWHRADEYMRLDETENSIRAGLDLLCTLGGRRFVDRDAERGVPLVEVTGLRVPSDSRLIPA